MPLPLLEREELTDEIHDAMSDVQDMDTTLMDFAKAAVKAVEPRLCGPGPSAAEWKNLEHLISEATDKSFQCGQKGYGNSDAHAAWTKATKDMWMAFFKLVHRNPATLGD